MLMGLFGGGGASKPKAAKAPKGGRPAKGGSSAIKEKSSKLKGGKDKGREKISDKDAEPDRRPEWGHLWS